MIPATPWRSAPSALEHPSVSGPWPPSFLAFQPSSATTLPDGQDLTGMGGKMGACLFVGADKIGYVPRRENAVVARLLDQCVPLRARVTRLRSSPNPWERVRFEVRLG